MADLTEDHVAGLVVLTLNRPEKLNAMSEEMVVALEKALDRHEKSDAAAIVITGAGRAFCAGTDLHKIPTDMANRVRRMHTMAKRLIGYPKISVAAVNGLAFGGGLELALACTLRVATAEAPLGLPEVKLATLPAYGGVPLLIRAIGEQHALRTLLTGEPVNGEEARLVGLVTMLDPDPLDAAISLAKRCIAFGQPVQRAIRRACREMGQLDLEAGWALEKELNEDLVGTPESLAAIRAFTERARNRAP